MKKLRQKAFTLVEVIISSVIFGIAFFSLLLGLYNAKFTGESGIIRFVSLHYSQGLLELIQSYDYEDSAYSHTSDNASDASQAYASHTVSFGSFDSSVSGVYDNSGNLVEALDEEALGLKYHPTTIPASADALNPFERNTSLQINTNLIGPEEDDISGSSNPATGEYRITETERTINVFAFNGKGQEKYYFFDDVDDFDGFSQTVELLPDMPVTFEISVTPIFSNVTDYSYTILNTDASVAGTETINQNKFTVMQDMSITNLQTLCPDLLLSDDILPESQKLGYGYYNLTLFKKITVKATWEYPKGSGKVNSIVIDGGKVNPRGSIL